MIADRTKADWPLPRPVERSWGLIERFWRSGRNGEALERLAGVADRLSVLKAEGLTVRAIADRLNAEGVLSPAGGAWQAGNAHWALSRLDARAAPRSA